MKVYLKFGFLLATLIGISGCSETESQSNNSSTQQNQETTVLRFSHFWPAASTTNTEIFEYWAKNVEQDSNGRIKVEIFPSATLSKPDATYEAVANGVVDIGSTLQGYTNGRFPLT